MTRDRVEREHRDSPAFPRVHHVSSAARASFFGALVPASPHASSVVATVAALAAAAWFTGWYPAQRHRMPAHG